MKDSTFEFEKRRNVPVRYDRELMATTLKAMNRVLQIRQKRQNQFIKNRLVKDRVKEKEEQLREVHKNIDLLMAPAAPQRKVEMERLELLAPKKMEVDH